MRPWRDVTGDRSLIAFCILIVSDALVLQYYF